MFGGSQYQSDVSKFMPQNVGQDLSTTSGAANQLWNVGQPSPVYNKKGKQTGTRWDPLALQGQLPQYKQDVNQGTAAINAAAPGAMADAYAASATGANTAQQASQSVPGMFGLGSMFMGMAPGVMGQAKDVMSSQLAQIPGLQEYAGQALTDAFDPQGDAQRKYLMQTRDIAGAAGQAAGLGSSPYQAGVTTDAMTNALLDWRRQQIQNEATGAGTAGSLYGTIAGLPQAGESLYNIGQGLGTTGAGLDTSALGLGQGAAQLQDWAGKAPLDMAESITQGKLGLQDALTQAKTNMYNQRTGGFNALNQYLGTAGNFIKDAIAAQGQNLQASQTGMNDVLGFASLPLQMMGK
jgi:hypothetical protein